MKKHSLYIISLFVIAVIACSIAFADANHEHAGDQIKKLITQPLTIQIAIIALVVSFVLGGLHALTPGHGKAVVAAYLVGSRGRIIDAVLLGLVVTFTHTISVITLGVILLLAKDRFVHEDIVLWLSMISGILIVGIGGWLLVRNIKNYKTGGGHNHGHDHTHGGSHEHGHNPSHEHTHGKPHSHGPGHSHSHVPSERTGFLGLITLGISGGIVPCVDALLGLLFAISLNKLTWGVIILCAFSLGLAAVLVAIGILMVVAKPIIARFTGEGIWLKRMPIISATVVIILGAVLVYKAFNDVGIHI